MKTDKKILDACCGSRMMWFDKNNPDVLYMDIRSEDYISSNGYKNSVRPDVIADFTKMPFESESFNLVAFDIPHRSDLGKNSWMANQYGVLAPPWKTDIKAGFNECMRVLIPGGTLIFKWNEKQIKTKTIIEIIGQEPLFGHKYGKNTIWMTFMKPTSPTL